MGNIINSERGKALFDSIVFGKRCFIQRQYSLDKYDQTDDKQHTKSNSCDNLRKQQTDTVHIAAAEEAAKHTQIERIK